MSAPAGWYPQDGDETHLRFWDGSAWTAERNWDGTTWVDAPGAEVADERDDDLFATRLDPSRQTAAEPVAPTPPPAATPQSASPPPPVTVPAPIPVELPAPPSAAARPPTPPAPPVDSAPAAGGGSRGKRPLWIIAAAVLVAIVASAVTVIVVGGNDKADAATIVLEPSNSTGTDPFTESVTIDEITEFPDTVNAVIATNKATFATDPTTATLITTGTTPGLYGGTQNNNICDPQKLIDYLTNPDNTAKATAWATTAGITTDKIPTYIASLTPTVLTTDTRVTNHGYTYGTATPHQATLQAGTAVLIDNTGTPRVRCSCGNPLTNPTNLNTATTNTTGDPWPNYQPNTTTTITPGQPIAPTSTFTITNITTGDTYQQTPGTTTTTDTPDGPERYVAISSTGEDLDRVSTILTSTDGSTWTTAYEERASNVGQDGEATATEFTGVASHGDTVVVVGTAFEQGGFGLITTSTDGGTTWATDGYVGAPLSDVIYANGQWIAIGDSPNPSSSEGPLVFSGGADASTWTQIATIPDESGYLSAGTIAYNGSQFLLTADWCEGDACGTSFYSSTNATAWTPTPAGGPATIAIAGAKVGFNGSTWGVVGSSGNDMSGYRPISATTSNGLTWETHDIANPGDGFASLAWTGDKWIAASWSPSVVGAEVWTSTDIATWTRVGQSTADLTDVITVAGQGGSRPPTTASPFVIDLSNPIFSAYDGAIQLFGYQQFATFAQGLTSLTGVTWTPEMAIALSASGCQSWSLKPDTEFDEISEQGEAEWAAALAPAIGISTEVAAQAIDSQYLSLPCG